MTDIMMKFTVALSCALAVLCGCSAVTGLSGTVETIGLEIMQPDYSSLSVSGGIHVEWSSDASSATVRADVDVLPYVVAESSGNTLKLYLKDSRRFRNGTGRIDVCLPAVPGLDRVKLAGASSFVSASPLSAVSFMMDLSGASLFEADIDAEGKVLADISGASTAVSGISASSIDLNVSGASSAMFRGTVSSFNVDASGASSVSSARSRVTAAEVSCDVSGASSFYVDCTSKITGTSSGASKVRYGNAGAVASVSCSGASSVSAK